jgi:hypothetical protein
MRMNLLFEVCFKLTLNTEVEALLAVFISVFLLEQLQGLKKLVDTKQSQALR